MTQTPKIPPLICPERSEEILLGWDKCLLVVLQREVSQKMLFFDKGFKTLKWIGIQRFAILNPFNHI